MASFTPSGSGGAATQIVITGPANPSLSLVTLATGSTEYQITLPATCRQFLIRPRTLTTLQLAFTVGDSGTLFLTVPRGCFYAENDLSLTAPLDLFIQSPEPALVLEVLVWT